MGRYSRPGLVTRSRGEAHAEECRQCAQAGAPCLSAPPQALRMRCSELDAVNAGLEEQIEQLRGSRQELLCLMEEAEAGGAQREEALMQVGVAEGPKFMSLGR